MMNSKRVNGYRYYRYNPYEDQENLLIQFIYGVGDEKEVQKIIMLYDGFDEADGKQVQKTVTFFEGFEFEPFIPNIEAHVKVIVNFGRWILKGELKEEDLELLK